VGLITKFSTGHRKLIKFNISHLDFPWKDDSRHRESASILKASKHQGSNQTSLPETLACYALPNATQKPTRHLKDAYTERNQ